MRVIEEMYYERTLSAMIRSMEPTSRHHHALLHNLGDSHCLIHTGPAAFQSIVLLGKGHAWFVLSTALAVLPTKIVLHHVVAHSAAILLVPLHALEWKVSSAFDESTYVTDSYISIIFVLVLSMNSRLRRHLASSRLDGRWQQHFTLL